MSKQYGLIVPNKDKFKPVAITRPSIFNDDSDDSDTNQFKQLSGLTKPLKKQEKLTQNRAIEQDPTVYQYDEIYDDIIDKKRKESKLLRKDLERKPKYINKLLETAERRKKENERRIERQIQKERELEGEQFIDKESFVTTAYKQKLEELKKMDELEKREEYLENIGDVTKQQNLDGFYRHLYQQKINYDDDDNNDNDKKTNDNQQENIKKTQFKQRKYRKRNNSNDSDIDDDDDNNKIEQITIKNEHLQSNLDADSDFTIDSSDTDEDNDQNTNEITNNPDKNQQLLTIKQEDIPQKSNNDGNIEKHDIINVKNEEIIEQPPSSPPPPPPVKKPKIDIWKKRTVDDVFEAALQRYFERKALQHL